MKKDIQGLQDRLAKRQDKIQRLTVNIEKLQKKVEKIEGTEYEEERIKQSDIRWTNSEIEEKEHKIDQLMKEMSKIRNEIAEYEAWKNKNRDVAVLWEFLNRWKLRERRWYEALRNHYVEGKDFAKAEDNRADELEQKAKKIVDPDGMLWWREVKEALETNPEAAAVMEEVRAIREEVKQFREMVAPVMGYLKEDDEMDNEKLEADLSYEALVMYDRLLCQIEKITGTILDASELHIGQKGEINGFVTGKAGNAKVQTIGAGGYNIQRYHFRTLVHEVK